MANGPLGAAFFVIDPIVTFSSMAIVAVTLPFYIAVIVALIKHRKSSGTNGFFFRVYMIGGVIDVLALLNNYLGCIFPARGWFLPVYLGSPVLGKIFLVYSWGSRLCQGCTVILLAVSRTMAISNPMHHERFWVKYSVHSIVFQLLPGAILGGSNIFTEIYWDIRDNGGYYPLFRDNAYKWRVFAAGFAIQSLFCVVIIGNYAHVFRVFRKRIKLQIAAVRSSEKQRTENMLLYLSISVCALEVVGFLFSLYSYGMTLGLPTPVFYLVQNSMINLYSSVPPYLLIAFSTPFRRRLLGLFGLDSSKLRVTSISSQKDGKGVSKRNGVTYLLEKTISIH